ncbi:conserved hypothetical protein [Histoplasma capsulatum G186AR]|uniref:Uncharacterized protein n=1 Tax=Ajellomyces capsulatus (strain G186AR / H82 / ATCC MYA-2454 / RMSCC 2432) TaxID=447093 RepID=C0NBK7_AJECG|nr:uncharacterized protein HCBG_00503 [Histoplasma capsulatum G186AR]EEH11048.1 conserved hypothetical protein [Histoplasma capsulatum G186AR]
MASEGHSPCEGYSTGEEHPHGIASAWSELSYQSRAPDINGYLEPEWVSPHSSFPTSANPFVHTNGSMPTPISLSGTPVLEPGQSPSHSHHDLQYRDITDSPTHHGLGISGPTTTNYVQPGIFTYDHPHRDALDNHFLPESQVAGFGLRALNGPTQSNTLSTRSNPGRGHVNIAPNPDGLLKLQRDRKRNQGVDASQRRRSGSSRRNSGQRSRPSQMDRENEAVRSMRTERNLSWREIVMRINAEFRTNYSASCLQMRMTRMKHRAMQWPEEDVQALQRAYEFWESEKFEIISQKKKVQRLPKAPSDVANAERNNIFQQNNAVY